MWTIQIWFLIYYIFFTSLFALLWRDRMGGRYIYIPAYRWRCNRCVTVHSPSFFPSCRVPVKEINAHLLLSIHPASAIIQIYSPQLVQYFTWCHSKNAVFLSESQPLCHFLLGFWHCRCCCIIGVSLADMVDDKNGKG